MNEIQIFQNQEFGSIRIVSNEQGEPMFCAKDVCDALKFNNSRDAVRNHVETEDVEKIYTPTKGGKQLMNYVNESGLYALVLFSRLEGAKRFKHWVTSEVLPSIRKQGGYMIARTDESDEVILARALAIMQATLQRRDEQIAKLQPRADYADDVLNSVSCFTTTQLAKELDMSAQELNRRLCELRIQYWQSGQYLLYADYARQGYAKNRTHSHKSLNGDLHTHTYLVWTERGRNFIHQLLNPKYLN